MKRKAVFVLILIVSVTTLVKAQEPVFFFDPALQAAVEFELGFDDPTPDDMLNLIYLDAYELDIFDLTGLEYATNLFLLDLGINLIQDISPIAGLTELRWLYLDYNLINDISTIAEFEHFDVLDLKGNTLNTPAYCSYLPQIGVNNPTITEFIYDPNPNPYTNGCSTDIADLAGWTQNWLDINCTPSNNFCNGADLDHDNNVDLKDFAQLAKLWLNGMQ